MNFTPKMKFDKPQTVNQDIGWYVQQVTYNLDCRMEQLKMIFLEVKGSLIEGNSVMKPIMLTVTTL